MGPTWHQHFSQSSLSVFSSRLFLSLVVWIYLTIFDNICDFFNFSIYRMRYRKVRETYGSRLPPESFVYSLAVITCYVLPNPFPTPHWIPFFYVYNLKYLFFRKKFTTIYRKSKNQNRKVHVDWNFNSRYNFL